MSTHDDPSREDLSGRLDRERLEAIDDTLDVGASPPADDAERAWLAEQRFVHGLLRAANTADATAREARVAAILDATRREGRLLRWRPVVAVAAALLLGTLGVVALLGGEGGLPQAEAMVARVVARLDEPVDRQFDIRTELVFGRRTITLDSVLTVRRDKMFRLDGEIPMLGDYALGCDGETVWFEAGEPPLQRRRSVPLADAARLDNFLGSMVEDGFFDLRSLLARLPEDVDLVSVARVPAEQEGEAPRIRIEARGLRPRRPGLVVRDAFLLVDPTTDMIVHFECKVSHERHPVDRSIVFHYLGTVEPGTSRYSRPW